jgi:hypothetical protein
MDSTVGPPLKSPDNPDNTRSCSVHGSRHLHNKKVVHDPEWTTDRAQVVAIQKEREASHTLGR